MKTHTRLLLGMKVSKVSFSYYLILLVEIMSASNFEDIKTRRTRLY